MDEEMSGLLSEGLRRDLAAWRKRYPWEGERRLPQPAYRYHGREVFEAAVTALLAGKHLLLVGAKATGKNVLAENLAAAFGRPVFNVSLHINADAASLIGTDTFRAGEVRFRPGPVYESVVQGGFCVLDEMNMARNEALAVLHALLDDRRLLEVPGYGALAVHPAARFLATMNEGYAGTRELNEALASRFLVLRLPPLDDAGLVVLLQEAVPGLLPKGAEVLAALFQALAEKHRAGEISSRVVDLRGLIAAAQLIGRGLAPWTALTMGLVNHCLEAEEREVAADVLALFATRETKASQFFGDA